MTLENLVTIYIFGAVVTALGNRGNKAQDRRMYLWPLYWCYCLALFFVEVRTRLFELRRRYW